MNGIVKKKEGSRRISVDPRIYKRSFKIKTKDDQQCSCFFRKHFAIMSNNLQTVFIEKNLSLAFLYSQTAGMTHFCVLSDIGKGCFDISLKGTVLASMVLT